MKVGDCYYDPLVRRSKHYGYVQVDVNKNGWADSSKFLPASFDLVLMDVQNKGKVKGWHNGQYWDGLYVKPNDIVLKWKRLAYEHVEYGNK